MYAVLHGRVIQYLTCAYIYSI